MIFTGGLIAISTVVLMATLIVSLSRHQVPLAVGSTLAKVNAYFVLKVIFCFIAQVGCGYIIYASLIAFPKVFRFDVSYLSLLEDDIASPNASPLTEFESTYEPPTLLLPYEPSPSSVVLSDSRDTSTM